MLFAIFMLHVYLLRIFPLSKLMLKTESRKNSVKMIGGKAFDELTVNIFRMQENKENDLCFCSSRHWVFKNIFFIINNMEVI